MSDFYKDWNKSLSINDAGDVPFARLVDLTPKEREQACKNLNIASNDAIERLEDEFTDLRGDMATVSSDVASAVANANSALSSASAATTAAQAAIDSITGYATDLATVSSKADTNSGDIGTLSSDVSILSANVGAISGKNTSQDTKIGELSSSVAGLTNSAVYHEAVINNLTTAWTAYSADLKNDFDTFSAAEDAVITAATAAIPGQVSAEVSGQLSGKQDKLTSANAGVNISISNAGVIDLHNYECSATPNSVAIGDRSKSINNYGFVHGRYATNAGQFNAMIASFNESASGTYNIIGGSQNVVAGNWNTVVGSGNTITANNFNFLQGIGNTIGNVQGAHAEGYNTSVRGSYSHAEGYGTSAVGARSHTEGANTLANAEGSHAEGSTTRAVGQFSHAEGLATTANVQYSHAEGYKSLANAQFAHADGDRVSAVGYASHALGKETLASGQYSFAIGNYARASGDESFANGTLTRAIGADTHAEGVGSSADGRGAHAEGHNTYASGSYAHTEGETTRALADGAHSEGIGTNASGTYSHAEGNATRTSGIGSHAEGYATSAIGEYSHAEGNYTVTNALHSHAEGAVTSAMNQYSHVEGIYTISDTVGQHVEGQYNAPATGALHVIGNGTSTAQRSNIVETYTDRVVVNGNLINDTKDATMTQFMFDNYNYPTTSTNYGKILTSGCKVSTNSVYNVQQYTLGNYTMNVVSGITGAGQPGVSNPSGVIVDWYGNVGPVMQGRYDSQWKPVAWPIDKLPRNVYNSYSQISFVDFSKWNLALTELPSGWYNSFTAYCSEPGSYLYHCRGMFYHCINLTGDVKPWMDFVLTQSAGGQAGASDRAFYRAGMFGDCSGIANYATLTADPTYSAFFITT